MEADNEVGLKIIETLGDDDEDMEAILTDVSIKEEDREIDIEAYSSGTPEAQETPVDEEDELPVDVDKVYAGE